MSQQNHDGAEAALHQLRMRLLDLTARNKLLSFRHTKRASLRVTDELPDQLLQILLDNGELRFAPVPDPTREQLIEHGYLEVDRETKVETQLRNAPKAHEWAKHLDMPAHFDLPDPRNALVPLESIEGSDKKQFPKRYKDQAIQTLLFPDELESCLRNLQRKTELAVQEMGTNVLYMAFGFLEWFDSKTAEKGRVAPLFLLPVNLRKDKLNAKSGTFEYLLSYSGEDITANLSLREKLKTDYSLVLPELNADEDISVEDYFDEVANMLRVAQPRWNIVRNATLGLFNFHKLLMYLDLDPDRWPDNNPITAHPVVAQFLGGTPQERSNAGFEVREEYEIDELEDVHDNYPLVFDADSSQHSAIVEVLDGKSLVVEGPPGTGKSQSIANLIAASIANGKRVLFVAEKLAALEVVKRRLDIAGLGDFALELHSHKTQKRQLLDSINQRLLQHGAYRDSTEIDADIRKYERLRSELSAHAELINSDWKNTGLSIFEIFAAATRYRSISSPLINATTPKSSTDDSTLSGTNSLGNLYNREKRDTQLAEISRYVNVFSATSDQLDTVQAGGENRKLSAHPWYGIRNQALFAHDSSALVDALQNWQNSIDKASGLTAQLARELDCKPREVAQSRDDLYQLPQQVRAVTAPQGTIDQQALTRLDTELTNQCRNEFALLEGMAQRQALLLPQVRQSLDSAAFDESELHNVGQTLSSRVRDDLTLAHAVKLPGQIETIERRLSSINERLTGAIQGLPANIQTRLVDGSNDGVAHAKKLLTSVTLLDPGLSDLRLRYQNIDNIKQELGNLENDIASVHSLRKRIEKILNTRRLGDHKKISSWLYKYQSEGLSGWLNSEWRQTRGFIQKLGAHDGTSLDDIVKALPDGIRFSKLCEELEGNDKYTRVFAKDYKGVNTDIVGLRLLVDWHDRLQHGLRKQSDSATWVDAIVGMPQETEKQLRQVLRNRSGDGILVELKDIQEDIAQLREALHNEDPVCRNNTQLIGTNGALETLRYQLVHSTELLAGFFQSEQISVDDVTGQLDTVKLYRQDQSAWQASLTGESTLSEVFGMDTGNIRVNDENWAQIDGTLEFADQINEKIDNYTLAGFIIRNPTESTITRLHGFAVEIENIEQEEQQAFANFSNHGEVDRQYWLLNCGTDFTALESRNYAAIEQPGLLSGWLSYQRASHAMQAEGLEPLVAQCEMGAVSPSECHDAWQGKMYDDLSREILTENPDLANFSGDTHQALRKQFKECDTNLLDLQRERLAWRTDQIKIPQGESGSRVSELTETKLLQHECRKKTRHIPIRQLVARAPNALLAIKPCFMMGPLSAAQYLAPGQLEFDIVVMDEASQIKPEDALGVIARGSQLVVVGDSKQLPPTSFFDRAIDDDNEDDTAVLAEQESILDATAPMFNSRRLRWHYRSQHESLIAFSNYNFYSNNLVVFPSPERESEGFGIKYFKIEGVLEKRTNQIEADAIAQAIKTHLLTNPDESIGVVAMNSTQRELIDATIESLSIEDPLLREAIEKRQNTDEPLFVKNLENVQGDERDVIVISLTYGPAAIGTRVMQRFGPINSADGWRRLNVLLTRSRRRMLVFSSMNSSDIQISDTSSRGVTALRDLLAYVETGILHNTHVSGREPDSDFEIAVVERLERRGYTCKTQIGVAGFFIDLAVVDPDNPGRFLVGIECDGATYHSGRSARDRDRLREEVLVRLGWEIRRIWSTDWFKDPDGEIDRIVRAIEKLKADSPAPEIDMPEDPDASSANTGIVPPVVESSTPVTEPAVGTDTPPTPTPPIKRQTLPEKLEFELNNLDIVTEPDVTQRERLLRPDMIQALVEYRPFTVEEFQTMVPSFLRRSIHSSELQHLETVVGLIKEVCENN